MSECYFEESYVSRTKTIEKIEKLETTQDRLQVLLKKEKWGTPEWLNIQWDIDDLIVDICALEQTL